MERLLQKIKEYNKIVIFGHIRPDGDCYGSQFGLKDIINQTFPQKEVYVVGGICNYVSFLGQMDEISDDTIKGSLGIVVDTGDISRASDNRHELCDYLIKIDHHINVCSYGDLEIVDEKSPACAQIITEFYYTFKDQLKISPNGAKALYIGILTDTGRFKYDNVSSKTFNYAGILVDLGISISQIDNQLSVENLNTVMLKGYVLSNFKITTNGFLYVVITQEIIQEFNVIEEEASSLVNLLSGIEGFPVWGLIIEYNEEIRIRLRSRGPEIDQLANRYNGGGHKMACGAKLDNFDQLDAFVDDCDKLVLQFKNSN